MARMADFTLNKKIAADEGNAIAHPLLTKQLINALNNCFC
jgi:hypothetical protein